MAVLVSILCDGFEELLRRAEAERPHADFYELRLDALASVPWEPLEAWVRACAVPVVLACNGPEAFGKFRGSAAERLAVLRRAAHCGAAYVDVDWRLARELGPCASATRRIVSRHDAEGAPQNLEAALAELEAAASPEDRLKYVPHARCAEDGLRVLALLARAQRELIAFASGERGRFTRVLAPIWGSPWTYAAPRSGTPSAPGQILAAELRAMWPTRGVGPQTAVFGVVGRPIAHSLSPRVHGAALRELELDAVFTAFEPDDFDAFFDLLDAPRFRGLAVTAPFKSAAFARATEADDEARAARAANTLIRGPSGWRAANTDVVAVRDALAATGEEFAGRAALVLGAGGAARAAVRALVALGARVSIAARDEARARELAAEFGTEVLAWSRVGELDYAVLVQATTVSRELVVPEGALRSGAWVLEANYRPLETPLLAAARRRGARVVSGADWFVRQAARQFELLTARKLDLARARREFERALAETS